MVEDSGGRKFGNAQQILILHIFGGIQATAGEKGILDAGGEHVTKAHLQIEVVQFLQQTVLHIIGKIGQTIPVYLVHCSFCQLHQLDTDVPVLGGAIPPLQPVQHGGIVFLPHFPQVGRFRALHRAGVRHIKNIFQRGPAPLVSADESNALGAGFHPPPHGFIPQLHAGAGGGVRALGIDQKLLIKRIFIYFGGGVQIPFPAVHTMRNGMGGLICQIGYGL